MTQNTTETSRFSQWTTALAQLGAALLIAASAALGSYYAFSIGSSQHVALGTILAAGALGGELLKPFAFVGAVHSLAAWQLVRAVPCLLVGCVCVAYSLAAELALSATSRSDLAAQRSSQVGITKRADDNYHAAKQELAMLAMTRPVGELQANIEGLLLRPGADGCIEINGPVTRDVCPKVAKLKGELARAERRRELQAVMATARKDQRQATVIASADPMADAVVLYAAAVGFTLEPTKVATWLHLLFVLFLEAGSAFGLVAARAVSGTSGVDVLSVPGPQETESGPGADQPDEPEQRRTARQETEAALVDYLKANGGRLNRSERGLAKLIGSSRSTTRRALNSLVSAGVIMLSSDSRSSEILLI